MDRIGIISDTHGLIRPEVREWLSGCCAILHAGDFTTEEVLHTLEEIAPVTAVMGNGDRGWETPLPLNARTELLGLRIVMAHKKKDLPKDLTGVDLAVFGHSHRYEDHEEDGIRFLNPGSCGVRRWNQPVTLAVLYTEDGKIVKIEKKELVRSEGAENAQDEALLAADPGRLVEKAVREIEKGRSVKEISKNLGISEALAESISRMYLTHPGVDTAGILKRIGR